MNSRGSILKPLTGLLWVSLVGPSCFVIERFAYNVLSIGVPYHHAPTMFLWLLLLPWVGYWFVLVRSTWLSSRRRVVRVGISGVVALLLAVGFFYASVMVFWTVANSRGVQFW